VSRVSTSRSGPRAVADLVEQLAASSGWTARFEVLEAALVARVAASPPLRGELTWAYGRLRASGGHAPVQTLATELGWSRRHLAGQFSTTFGVPPKRLGRLIRFERASAWLERTDRPDLATVAAVTGFSGQAHLTREMRRFSGLPPAELATRYGHADGGWWET
jgi:transcriptional regulator GlxA family with amidase domain